MERDLVENLPARRVGEMLRGARKRRGWKRRQAAAMVRISSAALRAYERGERRIPDDVWNRLAECYGNDLDAQFAPRVAPAIDDDAVVVAGQRRDPRDGDIIGAYAAGLRQLRHAKPGASVPLRAADIAALAAALDAAPEAVEQQIMDAIGCSRGEARALHAELLRRKIIVPVAGLAAGVVVLAGVHAAQAAVEDHRPDPSPVSGDVPAVTVPAPVVAPPTSDITLSTTTPTVPVVAVTSAPPVTLRRTTTVSPVLTPQPVASEPVVTPPSPTAPSIPEDDTPEGVLPGEHPLPHP